MLIHMVKGTRLLRARWTLVVMTLGAQACWTYRWFPPRLDDFGASLTPSPSLPYSQLFGTLAAARDALDAHRLGAVGGLYARHRHARGGHACYDLKRRTKNEPKLAVNA